MKKINSIEEYIITNNKWQDGLMILHEIIVASGLDAAIKWGVPVYSQNGKNMVGIAAFKDYFALWFYQGVLLTDSHKLLMNAQEGATQALRQWRFKSANEIDPELVSDYIKETIENFKAGREIKANKNKPVVIPKELLAAFKQDPEIERCFKEFSHAKQREFTEYLAAAKRPETRLKRLDKAVDLIIQKIGLNDKYR
ncbi:MAG: YdeI family protein [Salinivirgaceae bacterium]